MRGLSSCPNPAVPPHRQSLSKTGQVAWPWRRRWRPTMPRLWRPMARRRRPPQDRARRRFRRHPSDCRFQASRRPGGRRSRGTTPRIPVPPWPAEAENRTLGRRSAPVPRPRHQPRRMPRRRRSPTWRGGGRTTNRDSRTPDKSAETTPWGLAIGSVSGGYDFDQFKDMKALRSLFVPRRLGRLSWRACSKKAGRSRDFRGRSL